MELDQIEGLCLVRHELGPVADDLWPVTASAGGEDIGEVFCGRQVRSGILVHKADAGCGRSRQGDVDVGAPVGRADAVAEGVPGRVVGLAGD